MSPAHWLLNVGVLSWGVLTLPAYGQTQRQDTRPATMRIGSQTDESARVAAASAEIRKQQPQISDQVLEQDSILIKNALPKITAEFWNVGLTEEDALSAA